MSRRFAFIPTLSGRLEDRLALSHLGGHTAPHVTPLHHHAQLLHAASVVSLDGLITGQRPLNGAGAVSPLGRVTTRGAVTAHGAEPVVFTGTITLSGPTGGVTAQLKGRLFGPTYPRESVHLTYTITGGTGAFRGATGSGKALFLPHFNGSPTLFMLSFGDAALPP
jgi:hypothetical protein